MIIQYFPVCLSGALVKNLITDYMSADAMVTCQLYNIDGGAGWPSGRVSGSGAEVGVSILPTSAVLCP